MAFALYLFAHSAQYAVSHYCAFTAFQQTAAPGGQAEAGKLRVQQLLIPKVSPHDPKDGKYRKNEEQGNNEDVGHLNI